MSCKNNDPEKGVGSGLIPEHTRRRDFLNGISMAAAAGNAALATGCLPSTEAAPSTEEIKLCWQEFFKKNYRLVTQAEKDVTVARLERLAKLQRNLSVQMSSQQPLDSLLQARSLIARDGCLIVLIDSPSCICHKQRQRDLAPRLEGKRRDDNR